MRILAVGDNFITVEDFQAALHELSKVHKVRIVDLEIREKGWKSNTVLSEYLGSPHQMIQQIGDSEALIVHFAPVTRDVMEADEHMRVIVCCRGGPTNVDVNAATEMGIPVLNTPGRNATAVAEFTLGLLIAETRHIARTHSELKRRGVWRDPKEHCGFELSGKTLGLIGLGSVGTMVAVRAKAFDMNILAYDPYIPESVEGMGIKLTDLKRLLRESDFISIHARLTPQTRGLIGRDELALMKPTAYLINTARGAIVDEEALYETLRDHRIAGAAIDVWTEEPVKPDNPLLKLDNVTVTPHIAGASRDSFRRSAVMAVEELERFMEGNPLHVVNPNALRIAHKQG